MSNLTDRIGGARTSLAAKAPCRVATTANITLSGYQTIDGEVLAAGDANLRVLAKNQTDTRENGIWDVGPTAWTRAKDCNRSDDLQNGTMVYVSEGTTGVGWYKCVGTDPIVVGTSAISWALVQNVLVTSTSVTLYDTKALANAAIGNHADGDVIEVAADETYNGDRTRYRRDSGAWVYLYTAQFAGAETPVMLGFYGARMPAASMALRQATAWKRNAVGTPATYRLLSLLDSVAERTAGPWSAWLQRRFGGIVLGGVATQDSEGQSTSGGKLAPLVISVGTAPQVSGAYQYGVTGQYYDLSSTADLTWGVSGVGPVFTKLKIYYVKEPGAGSVEWFIDGVSQGVFSAAAASVSLGIITLTNGTGTASTPLRSLVTVAGVKILYVLHHSDVDNGVWRFGMNLGGVSIHNSFGSAQGNALTAAMVADWQPNGVWTACKENLTEGASTIDDRLADWASIIDANVAPGTDVVFEVSHDYVPRAGYDPAQHTAAVGVRYAIKRLCLAHPNYVYFDGLAALGMQTGLDMAVWGAVQPVRYVLRGVWSNATTYTLGDVSYPSGGSLSYRYINSSPSSGNALTNATYWRAQWQAYSGATTYSKNDIVSVGIWFYSYISDTPSAGNAPPILPTMVNTYWQLIDSWSIDGTHPSMSANHYLLGIFNTLTGLDSNGLGYSPRPVNDSGISSVLASGSTFSAGKHHIGQQLKFSALSLTTASAWRADVQESFELYEMNSVTPTRLAMWSRFGSNNVTDLAQYASYLGGRITLDGNGDRTDANAGKTLLQAGTVNSQANSVIVKRRTSGSTVVDGNLQGAGIVATSYFKTASYTVGTVPSASALGVGSIIWVSDETGGATLAMSDSVNWRRVSDRAIVS